MTFGRSASRRVRVRERQSGNFIGGLQCSFWKFLTYCFEGTVIVNVESVYLHLNCILAV